MSSNGYVIDTDLGWLSLLDSMQELAKLEVHVGVVGAEAAEMHSDSGLTNGEIAIIQEFGTSDGHIPPRPFVKATVTKYNGPVVEAHEKVVRDVALSIAKPRTACEGLGIAVAHQMKAFVVSSEVGPANKPSTIMQKGSEVPLIDDGQLFNAIGFKVAGASLSSGEGLEALDLELHTGDEGGAA